MVRYSRADSWLGWGESRESDNVLRSLGRIFQISMHGLVSTFQSLFTGKDKTVKKRRALSVVNSAVIFVLATLLMGAPRPVHAQVPGFAGALDNGATDKNPVVPPGQFRDTFSLNDAGSPQIELHGIDSSHSIYFTLPQTHVARSAKIHVFYAFSPSLLPQLSHLKLILNGTLFATIQPTPGQVGGSSSKDAEGEFAIPAE